MMEVLMEMMKARATRAPDGSTRRRIRPCSLEPIEYARQHYGKWRGRRADDGGVMVVRPGSYVEERMDSGWWMVDGDNDNDGDDV